MDSPQPCIIKGLVVYRNDYFPALIRTVNVYQYGEEDDEINEREYLFHRERNYEECFMMKIFTAQNFDLNQHYKGRKDGVWECIYVFDINIDPCPDLDDIPSILSIERNSKLQSIPSLLEDLEAISHQCQALDNGELSEDPSLVSSNEKDDNPRSPDDGRPSLETSDGDCGHGHDLPACFRFDLNSLPPPDSDDEGIDLNRSG
ncbi:hypothetical protein LIER_33833 [Lithospermum erythrorhizon]|uniref:Uncharacterized protein n=1 Tax=Lithospermum erythrorhizon TaxID=34254 RepID=A0AAV3S158_LITER